MTRRTAADAETKSLRAPGRVKPPSPALRFLTAVTTDDRASAPWPFARRYRTMSAPLCSLSWLWFSSCCLRYGDPSGDSPSTSSCPAVRTCARAARTAVGEGGLPRCADELDHLPDDAIVGLEAQLEVFGRRVLACAVGDPAGRGREHHPRRDDGRDLGRVVQRT